MHWGRDEHRVPRLDHQVGCSQLAWLCETRVSASQCIMMADSERKTVDELLSTRPQEFTAMTELAELVVLRRLASACDRCSLSLNALHQF